MVSRRWVWGDKRMGYAVRKLAKVKAPWRSEVWFKGRVYRSDDWATEEEAVDYAKQRKKGFYGGKTPAQARKAFSG